MDPRPAQRTDGEGVALYRDTQEREAVSRGRRAQETQGNSGVRERAVTAVTAACERAISVCEKES